MSSPARALQAAVFAALSADAALTALIGADQVHDGPPRTATAPYLHLGEMTARDWSTSTEAGTEIVFAIVAWSRQPGRSEALAIAERVREVLDDAPLALAGQRLVNLRHLSTETARADKPEGRRAVVRFRAAVEHA